MTTQTNKRKFLTREEAAEYLGASVATLSKWACERSKPLPYFKIGKNCMYKLEDLDAFIEYCRVEMPNIGAV